MTFTLPLPGIRPLLDGDGEAYELTEPLAWGDERIDAGYVTDLASVPRPARTLAPASGRHTFVAVRHDARCDDLRAAWEARRAGRPYTPDPLDGRRRLLTSREADTEFYEGLREVDPRRPLRALAMWAGVRLGAVASPWRRDRQAWADLPSAVAVALLIAPLYLPVIAVNTVALVLDEAAQRAACLVARPRPTPAPVVALPARQPAAQGAAA